MNIGYFSHYFVPEIGAPSSRIYDLSQQWLDQGHQVEVVTCFPNHPLGTLYPGYKQQRYMREQIDGIQVHRNWTYLAANSGFLKKTLGHISLWPSIRLFSEQKVGQLDAAIGTSPTFFAAMAAYGVAKRRNIPFIMEVRDLWPSIFVELGVLRQPHLIKLLEKWELWMYSQAAKIITVTDAFRQNLIKRGVAAEKIHTIPNGADAEYWRPMDAPCSLRQQLNLEECFTVLYIGAHGISQSLSHILESAEQFRAYPDIRFLLVGEGAEKKKLIEFAKQHNLTNVRFLDGVPKEQVRQYYALSDVCLVPLRDIPLFETFIPSKMFEIMAMGRPIIGSLRGEAAAILEQSGGAVVVAPEDQQGIATAIWDLYDKPQKRVELSENGRKFVVENYSRRDLSKAYVEVIDESIKSFRSRN